MLHGYFIIYIETEDFYKDIANDVEERFDTSKYDENDKRALPIGKNKKAHGFFKDELDGKIMTKCCALRAKVYAYLMEAGNERKKAKGTKKYIMKKEITFENYRKSFFNSEILLKLQQRFKSGHYKVRTEEVNKIALSGNDDKRLQIFDKTTTYPYGTNAFNVCESEMLAKKIAIPIKLYYN